MRIGYRGLFALLSAILLATAGSRAPAMEFKDTDWSHGFRSNCTLPGENSVRLHAIGADQKVAFTLKPGDVGGCSSDAKPRHGARYWERAELKQTSTLAVGQTHRISFEATFEQGFRGKAETFFQIHAWSRDCKSAPLLMLQFDQKRLKTHVLQRTSDKFQSGISRGNKGALAEIKASRSARKTLTTDALAGGPHRFDITFDTSGRNARMSVKMDGMPLVKNERVHLQRCVRPHVKFGIYRPGKTNRKTSVLLIDDVVISSR